MRLPLLFIIMLVVSSGCKKQNNPKAIDYPTEITFKYNGHNVTYGVIKKDYYNDFEGATIEKPITKLWMDRNLGAERQALSINDSLARGDLFQWGRDADGHQLRTSDTSHQLSYTTHPNHSKFIAIALGSNDWLANSDDSLWNDNQNTNCPCPEGWRVPTGDELLMEMFSWDTTNIEGAFNSSLKWTSSGIRSNHGVVRYSDYWSFIWSSTPSQNKTSMSLSIIGTLTSEVSPGFRINGESVRCIKDIE